MSSQPRLPLDVQALVINQLYLDERPDTAWEQHRDSSALRAAALVCREWRPLAQRLLFHEVVLSSEVHGNNLCEVMETDERQRSPSRLASHVKVLLSQADSSAFKWPLVPLLRRLPHLERLYVQGLPSFDLAELRGCNKLRVLFLGDCDVFMSKDVEEAEPLVLPSLRGFLAFAVRVIDTPDRFLNPTCLPHLQVMGVALHSEHEEDGVTPNILSVEQLAVALPRLDTFLHLDMAEHAHALHYATGILASSKIDVVHCWSVACLSSLKQASKTVKEFHIHNDCFKEKTPHSASEVAKVLAAKQPSFANLEVLSVPLSWQDEATPLALNDYCNMKGIELLYQDTKDPGGVAGLLWREVADIIVVDSDDMETWVEEGGERQLDSSDEDS